MKDILTIEKIQRRATKFILNDFSSDYKSRLISLGLLPLMFIYELFDILFFLKCLKRTMLHSPLFPQDLVLT